MKLPGSLVFKNSLDSVLKDPLIAMRVKVVISIIVGYLLCPMTMTYILSNGLGAEFSVLEYWVPFEFLARLTNILMISRAIFLYDSFHAVAAVHLSAMITILNAFRIILFLMESSIRSIDSFSVGFAVVYSMFDTIFCRILTWVFTRLAKDDFDENAKGYWFLYPILYHDAGSRGLPHFPPPIIRVFTSDSVESYPSALPESEEPFLIPDLQGTLLLTSDDEEKLERENACCQSAELTEKETPSKPQENAKIISLITERRAASVNEQNFFLRVNDKGIIDENYPELMPPPKKESTVRLRRRRSNEW